MYLHTMSLSRKINEKATETVTFRLRRDEKLLLNHLASLENTTLTGLVRSMLTSKAKELDVTNLPTTQPRRKPGRPPQITNAVKKTTEIISAAQRSYISQTSSVKECISPNLQTEITFGDLVVMFQESFLGRAEGTRRDLAETVDFLKHGLNGGELIPMQIPLSQLTLTHLDQARISMKTIDIRLSKKNLHLTYLRMMLHFAIKQPDIVMHINPAINLRPFTLKELSESWPGPRK